MNYASDAYNKMQSAYNNQNDPNNVNAGAGKEEPIKNHFITREGTYKLMTLSEYSRPSRVPLNSQAGGSNVGCAPVRVSFLTVPPHKSVSNHDLSKSTTATTSSRYEPGSSSATENQPLAHHRYPPLHSSNQPNSNFMNDETTSMSNATTNATGQHHGRDSPTQYEPYFCPDRICFNVGRELYVYMYRGVRNAADLSKPVDKRVYKGTYPTCHDFNQETATADSCWLIIGFSAGQIQLIDPFRKDCQVSKLYNEDRLIDKTRVTCLRWVPGQSQHFLASHSSGCMYLYNEELPCSPGAPTYQVSKLGGFRHPKSFEPYWTFDGCTFKTGDGYSVQTCKTKTTRNPMYRWQIGTGALNEFAFSGNDAKYMATVSQDGYMRVFNYHSMELVGFFRSYFGGLLCIAWSPDSKYIATGGEDDMVSVYAVQEKRVVCRGQGHRSWISQVAFDPYTTLLADGGYMATAGVPVDLGSEEDLRPSMFVGASGVTPFRSVMSSSSALSSGAGSLSGAAGAQLPSLSNQGAEDILKQHHTRQHRASSLLHHAGGSTSSGTAGALAGNPNAAFQQSNGPLQPMQNCFVQPTTGTGSNQQDTAVGSNEKNNNTNHKDDKEKETKKSGRSFLSRKKDKEKDKTSSTAETGGANTSEGQTSNDGASGSTKKLHRRGFSLGARLGGSNSGGARSARGTGSADATNAAGTTRTGAAVAGGDTTLTDRLSAMAFTKTHTQTADETSKLLGTPQCPRIDECPVIEPLVCKKIAHERLTVLEFREDCVVTACQEGFICTWARPGRTQGLSHQQSINSPNPGGSPNLLPGGTVV